MGEEEFSKYLNAYEASNSRSTSGVLTREYGKKIIDFLKGQKSAEEGAKERQKKSLIMIMAAMSTDVF